ncbi:MAG: hypothetical protein K2M48_01675 [Clostridiales bacterium]|nr:hypothetical protein [Clostridiales bacterium]
MKTKRSIICILACALCLTAPGLCGCADDKVLERPKDTDLEFWITDKVSEEALKNHYRIPGFGCEMFFGKDYQPNEINGENSEIEPDHCVVYTVTAYPDYSSNNGHIDTVTHIKITDPNVSIYGVTCNSTFDEFDAVFKDLGCKIEDRGTFHLATYGKTSVSFVDSTVKSISISVEVTNKDGIDF